MTRWKIEVINDEGYALIRVGLKRVRVKLPPTPTPEALLQVRSEVKAKLQEEKIDKDAWFTVQEDV